MKANGLMTFKKVMAKKHGKMVQSMRASTDKVRSMDMGATSGVMDPPTLAIGSTTRSTGQASIPGQTDESTLGCGKRTRCMGMDTSFGQMAANTKASSSMM